MFHVTCMDLGRFPCMLHECYMRLTCTVHVHVTCMYMHESATTKMSVVQYVAIATGTVWAGGTICIQCVHIHACNMHIKCEYIKLGIHVYRSTYQLTLLYKVIYLYK